MTRLKLNLEPDVFYTEDELCSRGIDRKLVGGIRAYHEKYGFGSEGGFWGGLVTNYLFVSGLTNGLPPNSRYMSAYLLSQITDSDYSSVLRREDNKRPLVRSIEIGGETDMRVDVSDLHLFLEETGNDGSLTSLVIEYQDRRSKELLERICREAKGIIEINARKYAFKNPHEDLEEFVASGYYGLLDAVRLFDRERGVKFQTYAAQRINGAILDDLRDRDTVTRLNREREEILEAAHEKFAGTGINPSDMELMEETGLTHEQLDDLRDNLRFARTIDLDSEVNRNGEGKRLRHRDIIKDAKNRTPLNILMEREVEEIVREELETWTPNVAAAFSMHIFDGMTMLEIGAQLGLSESRICQFLGDDKYLEKLRQKLGLEGPEAKKVKVISV